MKDLGKAFSFPFKDPAWITKFVIAGLFMLLCLIGIGIPIIVGYMVQVTQRVMRREDNPFPEWSDIGVKFVTGFKFCIVYLIYILPIMLLFIPVIAIGVAGELSDSPEVIHIFATVYLFAVTLIIIPYSMVLAAIVPILAYRYSQRERISDALDIGTVFRDFKVNWQNTLIVALIAVGLQSFAYIGFVLFIIGIVFTIFYSYLVSAYMHGLLFLELPPEQQRSPV